MMELRTLFLTLFCGVVWCQSLPRTWPNCPRQC